MKYIRKRKNGKYQVRIYTDDKRFSFTSSDLEEVIQRRNDELGYDPDNKPETSRVLLIDIETTPILAYVWGLWKQNIAIERIEEDWSLLCYAYKWLGDKEVVFNKGNEGKLLNDVWELFDEADVVVAHNGDKFDIKMLNTKFLEYGFTQPSPYKSVDTLKMARRKFRITSNKLDYISKFLGSTGKEKHHGNHFDLWRGCMVDDKESWKQMEKYNVRDVLELERIYLTLRKWSNHPVLVSSSKSKRCVICGSNNLQNTKPYKTNVSEFEAYCCLNCGHIMRSTSRKKRSDLVSVV